MAVTEIGRPSGVEAILDDIDRTRAQMDDTLDALKDRLGGHRAVARLRALGSAAPFAAVGAMFVIGVLAGRRRAGHGECGGTQTGEV